MQSGLFEGLPQKSLGGTK